MTKLIQDYQLGSFKGGFLSLSGFSTAGGGSDTISTPLATLASTATRQGGSLPLQSANLNSGSEAQGFVVTTPLNKVELRQSNGQHVLDSNGDDVYGRLTVSGSTWTVAYYSLVNGVETAYTGMASATVLTMLIPAFFTLANYPYTSDFIVADVSVDSDVSNVGKRATSQALTIATSNTIPSLSQTPTGEVRLVVNGVSYSSLDTTPLFSVSGTTITWNAANGFTLPVGANVIAYYTY